MPQRTKLLGYTPNSNPYRVPVLSGLNIAVSEPQPSSVFSTLNYPGSNVAFDYLGGSIGPLGPDYPLLGFLGTFNLTYGDGRRTGLGGSVQFDTDAQSFQVLTYASGFQAKADLFVDGKLLPGQNVAIPSDGELRIVTFDFSSAGFAPGVHTIELVYNGPGVFGGLLAPTGSLVRASEDFGPRVVVLGDSFTEGSGANSYALGYAKLAGRYLGSSDVWASGFGGTGYETALGIRPALKDRIVTDGVNANGDIYIVAMGINDSETSQTLYNSVYSTLSALANGSPNAKIFVLGAWNPVATLVDLKPNVTETIRTVAALFPNIVFLNPSDVPFTKIDPTHPDQAGHYYLAEWLASRIRDSLGSDGIIDQAIMGDIVGPLFVENWSASETYTYEVLENGEPSSRFEIIDQGDAFPTLKLKSDQSVEMLGLITVQIQISAASGTTTLYPLEFSVRERRVGTAESDVLTGLGDGVRIDGFGGDDILTGTSGIDLLIGGAGNDSLLGNAGGDLMIGGNGDDTYGVDQVSDIVREFLEGGFDTIVTSLAQFVLPDNVEALELAVDARNAGGNELDNTITGNEFDNILSGKNGNDQIFGGNGVDTLTGGSGNDFLDGGIGSDRMTGGTGNDVYVIDSAGDVVDELALEGIDTIRTSLSNYALGSNFENLTYIGTGNAVLTGNSLANVLEGGAGNDSLNGGAGDDTYVVGNIGDTITEALNAGIDAVQTSLASYTLGTNLENLTFMGSGAASLTGNALSNAITGADGDDTIVGAGGIDSLVGGLGSDRLVLGAGSSGSSIDGGEGIDSLTVTGTVTLGGLAGIEAVDLTGGAALTLTGSQFRTGLAANTVFSGTGAITVNLGVTDLELAAHTMSVAAGSTIALIVNGSTSGEIIKSLAGAVNTINGGGGGDQIRGGAQADLIFGDDGNDKLAGGQGADQLTGGTGADQFRFQSSASSGLGATADRVADFVVGRDLLVFRQIDTDPLTVGDQAFAFIGSNAFGASGAAQMRYANSGADLLVQADINGDGVADMEVLLLGLAGQPLNGSDFLL